MICDLVSMDEDCRIGKCFVIVDDVGKVHHGFMAFVRRWSKSCIFVIDGVYGGLEMRKLSRYPADILFLLACHNQDLGIC